MRPKEITTALFALILLAALGYLWFSPSGLKPVPAVALTTLEGQGIRTDGYRGRPLLVTFWATTCPGCVKEMPHLVELHKELAPRGLQLIAVAMAYDPPGQVREMVAQKGLPYPVAIDHDGAAARAFGEVKLTPTSFLIDPQGRIVQQTLGELDMGALRARILGMLDGGRGG